MFIVMLIIPMYGRILRGTDFQQGPDSPNPDLIIKMFLLGSPLIEKMPIAIIYLFLVKSY